MTLLDWLRVSGVNTFVDDRHVTVTRHLPGRTTAPEVSSSWLTSVTSLGRCESQLEVGPGAGDSGTGSPLTGLGLTPVPSWLCLLGSVLWSPNSFPAERQGTFQCPQSFNRLLNQQLKNRANTHLIEYVRF